MNNKPLKDWLFMGVLMLASVVVLWWVGRHYHRAQRLGNTILSPLNRSGQ